MSTRLDTESVSGMATVPQSGPVSRRRFWKLFGIRLSMRSNSVRTILDSGVEIPPFSPFTEGKEACSINTARGATSETSSASPNSLSKLQTLRSMGSLHSPWRSVKYPLTRVAKIRGSQAAAYRAMAAPSPYPATATGELVPKRWPIQSTPANTSCTS